MLIFVGQIWCESVKIPTFLDHFFCVINFLLTRRDVTDMVYVALGRHLIIGTWILTNVDVKLDANWGKIAATKNILFYT